MISLKKFTSLLFAVVLCGLATPSQAVFLTNASFENVNIAPPFVTTAPFVSTSLADVPGWTHSGLAGDAVLFRVGFVGFGGSVTTAGGGMQFVIMGGGYPDLGGIAGTASWQQTITGLTAGSSYLLEFMMAAEGKDTSQLFAHPAGSTQTIVVDIPEIGVSSSFTATNTIGDFWQDWENKSLIFTAGTNQTLKFSYSGLYDVGLDHVRISLVPEPASLVLLGIGLMGLVVARQHPEGVIKNKRG